MEMTRKILPIKINSNRETQAKFDWHENRNDDQQLRHLTTQFDWTVVPSGERNH